MTPKVFIFEGIDGSGKSTATRSVYRLLDEQYPGKIKLYRNPGGTKLGEKVRDIARLETTDPEEQLLAYLLAITSVYRQIEQDLTQGFIVLLDRWVQSTMVYQVPKLPLSLQVLYEALLRDKLGWWSMDLIFCDLSYVTMQERVEGRVCQVPGTLDRFEQEDETYRIGIFEGYQDLMSGQNFFNNRGDFLHVHSDDLTPDGQARVIYNHILNKVT